MNIAVVWIDLGKNTCSMAGLNAVGEALLRRRVGRGRLLQVVAELPPCIVAVEAWRRASRRAVLR